MEKELKEKIKQDLEGNSFGIIPSSRLNFLGVKREDNNLFFSLLAIEVLSSSEHLDLFKQIETAVVSQISSYKNKYGRSTYNFWRTHPNEQWPNSLIKNKWSHFWIPDDLDCTALSYLHHSEDEVSGLRKELIQFISKKRIGTYNLSFYSTWFGDKMKSEFDLCVLCNYLILLYKKGVKLNSLEKELEAQILGLFNDLDSIDAIVLSPNYQSKPIILWHIARLMKASQNHNEELNLKLWAYASVQLKSTVDQVWLEIVKRELRPEYESPVPQKDLEIFIKKAPYFHAPMLHALEQLPMRLRTLKIFNISFHSESFNAILILKYFFR